MHYTEANRYLTAETQTTSTPFHFKILQTSHQKHAALSTLLKSNKQDFLYILSLLKSYEPYSTPFLQKVSRKEAPDYHEVIAHPMDLSLMTKKVRGYTVDSFVRDLDLIWSNCLLYNTPVGTPYNASGTITSYALKMKERADCLVQRMLLSEKAVGEDELFLDTLGGVRYDKRNPKRMAESAGSSFPELFYVNNCLPLPPVNENREVSGLGIHEIQFPFHSQGTSFYFKRKRVEGGVGLWWNSMAVKAVLSHYISIELMAVGYKKVQRNVLRVFVDVVYDYIFRYAMSL